MADKQSAVSAHEDYLTLFWHEKTTLGALVAITSGGAADARVPTAEATDAGVVFRNAAGEVVGFNVPDAKARGLSVREGMNYPDARLLEQIGALLGVDLGRYADKVPFVVGRVLSAEQAGSVRACQVDVGGQKPQPIVCGGKNVRQGLTVAVVLPGGLVADGKAVFGKPTYGHMSEGMICSARELGFSANDADGTILELSGSDVPGRPYLEAYGKAKAA